MYKTYIETKHENRDPRSIGNKLSWLLIDSPSYSTELQLNKANSCDTEAPFLDLNLCTSNDTVSTKIYDKRDDFDFDIVNFPFLDGDVPRRTSYGVYISQLVRFARASSNLSDFKYTIIKPLLPNFLGRAIIILNFVRRFRNFIADTVPW